MAMQKWTLDFTVCGSSNSRFFVPFITKNGDAELDVGFYKGVVHPIVTSWSLLLSRMAMRMGRWLLQRCGSSNSRFFVPFIAKNGDAYGRWLYGVVHPIAASLSLSLPRMAMRMDVGFYKGVVHPIDFFVPFIAKNGDAYGRWLLQRCGSSNSRFFVPFIAKNGDAYGRWLYKADYLSFSLPRMAMQKWTLSFTVCGSSNSRFFVPFIAKNGNAYGRWLLQRCGSSNSRFFVPFIAKNGDAYGRWLYKGVVHPIASLSLSLPRMHAYGRWLYKGVVHPTSNSPFIAKNGDACGSSNSRFFVPFIAKNGDAKWTLALQRCGSSNSRFLSLSLPRMAMRMGRWLLQRCGSSNSRFFVPFIAKNGDAYGRWLLQRCGSSNSRFLSLSLPRMAMRMDAGFYKGVVHPIAASLSLSLPRMAMRMDAGFTKFGSSNRRFFVPFIAKNGDAYGRWLYKGVVHPIVALSLSLPRMAMRMDAFTKKWTLAFTVCGSSNSHFFSYSLPNDDAEPTLAFKGVVCPIEFFVPFIAKNGYAYGTVGFTGVVCPIVAFVPSLPRMVMRMDVGFYKGVWFIQYCFVPFIAKIDAYGRWLLQRCGSSTALLNLFIAKNGDVWTSAFTGGSSTRFDPFICQECDASGLAFTKKWTLAFTVSGFANSRLFVPFIAKNGDAYRCFTAVVIQ
ncbi:hypothetical protein K7X08_002680 [Anisodus acutangulus]|uniref:Uncharacterized protein n=1 Tax=Anisodus acutangulus TaxID=402998 RepID=A0A9Q1L2R3_9SOLA|nr:hypothetical protein K7X08_002680 [Anisodus acutangulus]